MFSNSISPRLIESTDKSAAVQQSAVFATRAHYDCERVF